MKKIFLSILVICSLLGGNAYAEMKCIQGDCKNGVSGAADKKKGRTWVGKFENGNGKSDQHATVCVQL